MVKDLILNPSIKVWSYSLFWNFIVICKFLIFTAKGGDSKNIIENISLDRRCFRKNNR